MSKEKQIIQILFRIYLISILSKTGYFLLPIICELKYYAKEYCS